MRITRLRTVLLLLTTAAVLAATVVAWIVARDRTLGDLARRADEGLSLKKSNIITEADRYRSLPSVVVQDDRILKLLDGHCARPSRGTWRCRPGPDDPIRVDLAN